MSKNWKDTLLMPETNFEMRANLVEKEKKYRELWLTNKVYEKALKQNENNDSFTIHDGPPYANGSVHVGHALNKILKDIIVRNKTLNGFYSPVIHGWDTHGLPIENKMLEKFNKSQDDFSAIDLRIEAEKYAREQVENQANQFAQMQLFSPTTNRYLTLDKEFEVGQVKLFKKMALEGLVYKGLKPVYWSPSSRSALAEAEVEYQDKMSPQVIVAFELNTSNDTLQKGDNLLIMTTTPWTLIANSGVAVSESIEYSLVKANEQNYVIASNLIESVMKFSKITEFEVLKTFKGDKLIGLEYIRPIKKDKTAPIVSGHHVDDTVGTGLVHMAPLFGEDDFLIGKKNKLEEIMHLADDGKLTSEAGEFEGIYYEDANKDIGMKLDAEKKLLSLKFIKHSYPHDWRTKKPIVFRGTPQWFVSIDSIKDKILKSLDAVSSYPSWGVPRLTKMIEGRESWTISRQRTWGVPITIFYDKDGSAVIEEELFDYVIDIFAKEGSNAWWTKETDELLPESYRGKGFTREMDIVDVWFDSGSSHVSVGQDNPKYQAPFDVYLEGSDQYRGWFNSSLINSVVWRGKAPFKNLISHGFVLDAKQQKMSKSIGNVVDPLDIINKNGADILRMWVANSEYTSDVTISDDIIKQNIEIYRRIRNTFKFMLGNLFDFDESKKVKLTGVHALIDEEFNNFVFEVNRDFAEFKFSNVIKNINAFLVKLSGFYLDFNKDTLYVEKSDNEDRRAVQTNMFNIVDYLTKALAAIIPTTAEEVYEHFNKSNKKESVMLEVITEKGHENKVEQDKWKEFFDFKDEVYKAIEEAKKSSVIRRNNEAVVTVVHASEFIKELDLQKLLMVAKVKVGNEIAVESFDSEKCQRCWNHFEKGTLNDDMLCQRCETVVKG